MNNDDNSIEIKLTALVNELLTESGDFHYTKILRDDPLPLDSLSTAELFRRIEKVFKVNFPDQMLGTLKTIADIADFIAHAKPGEPQQPSGRIVLSHYEKSQLELSATKSLVDVLLLYGEKYPHKTHIFFQNEEGQEEIITYGQLLTNALRVAKGLQDRGLFNGDCVAIMQPTTPEFFYTFFGTLLAGGVPVPIYPPFRAHKLEAYAKTEANILRSAEVRVLVTFKQAELLSKLLQSFVPSLKHVVTATELLKAEPTQNLFRPKVSGNGLIQYTSGSTSDPKGVLLSHANLVANIRAYGKSLKITPVDVTVSWLPLYHDLGLIGMWLGSLYHGIPLVLMTPFSFLNRPERWLWTIHHYRGTLSGAPNFAYELCIRKFAPELYEGLDLSTWRIAANGAEKVYPKTLHQFAEVFAPYGFKKTSLFPVYGLAETCVGLALPEPGSMYRVDTVDRKSFEEHSTALVSAEENALEFVGCGKPIEGHEVRIVDASGKVLPERHVGTLHFRGPSNMQGYYNNPLASQAVFNNGWIDSGDLAYVAEGDIFITGRRKDLIVKAGRNLYPVEIEECVGTVAGVRQGCAVAFSVADETRGTEQLVIVAETRARDKAEKQKIAQKISETIFNTLDIVPDQIVMVAPHVVPKTSSGKLQRAASRNLYLQGTLEKSPAANWLQIVKLTAASAFIKLRTLASNALKAAYTAYFIVLFGLLLIPNYMALIFNSRLFSARVAHWSSRAFLFLAFCPLKIKQRGNNKAQSLPLIYAANHASYLDSLVMIAILPPQTLMVGKKELLKTPILKTFMQRLHYLPVDRFDSTKGIEDTDAILRVLKNGASVMIFPEGTFAYGVGLRPFRAGAFKLAIDANVPICPIALQGTRDIWRGENKLLTPGTITVTIGEKIAPEGCEWRDAILLKQQVREFIAAHCGEPSLDFTQKGSANTELRIPH